MQVNALKTFSLAGMTKLTGGRAQIDILSLDMSYVLMEVGKSLWFSSSTQVRSPAQLTTA